jgi:hypothetical protein
MVFSLKAPAVKNREDRHVAAALVDVSKAL